MQLFSTLDDIGRRIPQAVGLPEFTRDPLIEGRDIFRACGNQNACTRDFRDFHHSMPGYQKVVRTDCWIPHSAAAIFRSAQVGKVGWGSASSATK